LITKETLYTLSDAEVCDKVSGQFINGPVVLATFRNDQLNVAGLDGAPIRRARPNENYYGKDVSAALQFLATTDFIGWRTGSKKAVELVFGTTLLGGVGEKQDDGFVVVGLPGVQKMVRGSKCGDVVIAYSCVGWGMGPG
jgi:hypothetical protein